MLGPHSYRLLNVYAAKFAAWAGTLLESTRADVVSLPLVQARLKDQGLLLCEVCSLSVHAKAANNVLEKDSQ